MPGLAREEVAKVANFRAALRGFLRAGERVARASGLTPQRYQLLLMIKGAPDGSERATVTSLGERLQLAQSTITELACRAEQSGLIARTQSTTDGRIAHLRLTEEGERRLELAFVGLEEERQALRRAIVDLGAEP